MGGQKILSVEEKTIKEQPREQVNLYTLPIVQPDYAQIKQSMNEHNK
jgi:hypothetical protein